MVERGRGFLASLGQRPTADLVILALTMVVCVTVVAASAGLIYVQVARPDADTAALARQVGGFISSLVAVIVGYVAGRGVNAGSPPARDESE